MKNTQRQTTSTKPLGSAQWGLLSRAVMTEGIRIFPKRALLHLSALYVRPAAAGVKCSSEAAVSLKACCSAQWGWLWGHWFSAACEFGFSGSSDPQSFALCRVHHIRHGVSAEEAQTYDTFLTDKSTVTYQNYVQVVLTSYWQLTLLFFRPRSSPNINYILQPWQRCSDNRLNQRPVAKEAVYPLTLSGHKIDLFSHSCDDFRKEKMSSCRTWHQIYYLSYTFVHK